MASGYQRRILHLGADPGGFPNPISDRAIEGAWFELHRRGGCGAGQLVLNDRFPDREQIELGDWIALEYSAGQRWYLGRVESRTSISPVRVAFELFGMGGQLAEVFPGGFGSGVGDRKKPHRYAQTDVFTKDLDHSSETVDVVSGPDDVVRLLLDQYIVPATDITYQTSDIEPPEPPAEVFSMKFRGEESAQSIIRELALRANDASWGVNAAGRFFFIRKRIATVATFQEGVHLVRLREVRDRDLIFNRLLLTGGYVYAEEIGSEMAFKGFYRWQGTYIQPDSRERYGERAIRLSVPWIRHRKDAAEFAARFFAQYAVPRNRYAVELGNQSTPLWPWQGRVRLFDRQGSNLGTFVVETLRVDFDHAPRFRIEMGPQDPRDLFPEPVPGARWEIPGRNADFGWGGDEISSSSGMSSLAGGTDDTFDDGS